MTDWAAFVGLTGAVLAVVLLLARLSQGLVTDAPGGAVEGPADDPGRSGDDDRSDGGRSVPVPQNLGNGVSPHASGYDGVGPARPPELRDGPREEGATDARAEELSTAALLANVTLSQGLFAAVLVGGAWYFEVPSAALGLTGTTPTVLAAGAVLGLALYVVNEVGAGVADRVGIGHDERLRETLAPDSLGGWVLLLGGVLPVIAGFEELLFRAALIGVVPAGYGVSPWLMVGLSSVAFGAGHGAQGRAGVAVTTALGAVLGAAFVVTGSLVAVVLAHYLVNALEFVVHEGLGVEWVPGVDR